MERVAWSRQLAEGLSIAVGPDLAEIRRGVILNQFVALRVGRSWAIYRVDPGMELVIMCYQGEKVRDFMARIIPAARANGLQSIRFHALRRGLCRLMARAFGFEYSGDDPRGFPMMRLCLQ